MWNGFGAASVNSFFSSFINCRNRGKSKSLRSTSSATSGNCNILIRSHFKIWLNSNPLVQFVKRDPSIAKSSKILLHDFDSFLSPQCSTRGVGLGWVASTKFWLQPLPPTTTIWGERGNTKLKRAMLTTQHVKNEQRILESKFCVSKKKRAEF